MAFVTSRYTMDKATDRARTYLAERADLLGAIRLPQTAFSRTPAPKSSPTCCSAKRLVDEAPGGAEVGSAWAKSPRPKRRTDQRVLRRASRDGARQAQFDKGKMRGATTSTPCCPHEGDIAEQFAAAVKKLPANVYHRLARRATAQRKTFERDMNPKAQKEGQLYVGDDGEIYRREHGVGRRIEDIKKRSPPPSRPGSRATWACAMR
jgi:hypothetical protein